VLYVHGIAFHRAYLASFGLSAEGFPLSVDQAMMRGFEAYFLIAARSLARFVSVSAVLLLGTTGVLLGTAVFCDWVLSRSWLRRMALRLQPWLWYAPGEQPSRQPVVGIVFGIMTSLAIVVAMFLFFGATASFTG
jgi:hypothetical protein